VVLAKWKVEKETDLLSEFAEFHSLNFLFFTTLEPWQNFNEEIGW